ncbi:Pex7p [Ascoidea rubescens DSM 1968]|uniref:Peroxin-7 n=1 Tax=Ascoidea rubescens DSM 1968 TaxID=1344418 RepID=A0A1D2VRJ2_9ASCO|nr:WD40 repeat-like protein [Ascoidea rubescens DSM 1968]ODV64233.1 WD40 repeat-like protein [Ascoidea rubescens DSM 1968]
MNIDQSVNIESNPNNLNNLKKSSIPLSNSKNESMVNTTTQECIYQVVFSPHTPNNLISVNASSHLHLWDIRSPKPKVMDFVAHGGLEALTCDWNKYRPTVIASAGVDKSIKIWDLRMITNIDGSSANNSIPNPTNQMLGHEFAIRKIIWSPHNGKNILSCSYDMTSRVWDDITDDNANYQSSRRMNSANSCRGIFNNHQEFVLGGDWSLWGNPGWVATTSWDEMVYIWDTNRL